MEEMNAQASRSVHAQCTDGEDHPGSDALAALRGQYDERIQPAEAEDLYDQATELVNKNKLKDDHIVELTQKILQLEKMIKEKDEEIQRVQSSRCDLTQDLDLGSIQRNLQDLLGQSSMSSEAMSGEVKAVVDRVQQVVRTLGDGLSCSRCAAEERTDRDMVQSLLVRLCAAEKEIKEMRRLYARVVEERDEMQVTAARTRREWEEQQQVEKNLRAQLDKLHWVEELCCQRELESRNVKRKMYQLQHKLTILSSQAAGQMPEPEAKDPLDHKLASRTMLDSDSENEAIVLPDQQSLKKGRFTMQRCTYECQKCFGSFRSAEEAASRPCCFHTKKPVTAVLRNNSINIDPATRDLFWPCCKKTGKDAKECFRNGTHKFSHENAGKNPER